MKICEHFQARMLDHLYELLDRVEEQALQGHLDDCGQCRAALTRAEQQRKQIADAARKQFPQVAFTAPAEPIRMAPVVKPERWDRRSVLRWSVAAGILLLLSGVGVPGMLYSQQRERVDLATLELNQLLDRQSELNQSKTEQMQATRTQFEKVQEQIALLEKRLKENAKQSKEEGLKQEIHLTVSGPGTMQPGANNVYAIQALNGKKEALEGSVSVRVLDRDAVVYEAKNIEKVEKGNFRVKLPADLAAKPNGDLTLEVSFTRADGMVAELQGQIQLTAPVYLTHLATDRSAYRPGDVIDFRSLTLERFSLKPIAEELDLEYRLSNGQRTITSIQGGVPLSGNGSPLTGPDDQPLRGIGVGSYAIPEDLEPGTYMLTVGDKRGRIVPQVRPITIAAARPTIIADLALSKDTKDQAKANLQGSCQIVDAKGLPYAKQRVNVSLQAEGDAQGVKNGDPKNLETDEEGRLNLDLPIPAKSKGIVLNMDVERDGKVERLSRTLSMSGMGQADRRVTFYPEGGELVAGVTNRVYFDAKDRLGKPARLFGEIVDDQGVVVADAATLADDRNATTTGLGVFTLVPQAGRKYALRVGRDEGSAGTFDLPAVRGEGVVLSVPTGVTRPEEPIRVKLAVAGPKRTLHVGIYCRGRLLEQRRVQVDGTAQIEMRPEAVVGGVYRVTVFEELPSQGKSREHDLKPVAERLVYRSPKERLQLQVTTQREKKVLGMSVECRDENERTQPAILMVAVTNPDAQGYGGGTATASLPTHFLLTTEVRNPQDLEDADFLLSNGPRAAEALDLLLGTQGWRRFAEQDPGFFRERAAELGEQMLVWNLGLEPMSTRIKGSADQHDEKAIDQQQRSQQAEVERLEKYTRSRAKDLEDQESQLEAAVATASARREAEMERLVGLRSSFDLGRRAAWWIGIAGLLALIVMSIVTAARRGAFVEAIPYCATAACAVVFVVGLTALYGDRSDPNLNKGDEKGLAGMTWDGVFALMDTAKRQIDAMSMEKLKHEGLRNKLDLKDSDSIAKKLDGTAWRQRSQTERAIVLVDRDQVLNSAPSPEAMRKTNDDAKGQDARKPSSAEPGKLYAETEGLLKATLLWMPAAVTRDGMLQADVPWPASLERAQVVVSGHTLDGRLGAAKTIIRRK